MFFILRQHHLTSFFLNEFDSPCVSKVPNSIKYNDDDVGTLLIRKLYFTLAFGALTVYFYSIFFNQLM